MDIEGIMRGMPDHGATVVRFRDRQATIDQSQAKAQSAAYYAAVKDGVSDAIKSQTNELIGYMKSGKKRAPLSELGYMEYDHNTM